MVRGGGERSFAYFEEFIVGGLGGEFARVLDGGLEGGGFGDHFSIDNWVRIVDWAVVLGRGG